jgi:methionyl-tRNA formyltransferase
VTAAACVPLPPGAPPGSVIAADKKGIQIACGQDALLLTRLIPEGKGEMSTADFLLGFPLAAGTVLSANPTAEPPSP